MTAPVEQRSAAPLTLAALGTMERASFVARFGHAFEHSPWVAERCWEKRPFASLKALHRAMVEVVRGASREQQLALIRAHPELGTGAGSAETLTALSREEQKSAGLVGQDGEEGARLRRLNGAYRQRFGFPFIIAVRGRTRGEILAALEERLAHDLEVEFERALAETAQIAYYRLADLVEA